ncbi:alpha beta hydrolase fold-3 domain containing protein [Aspergillus affinis]|uniref:alpha beta hydrolase fold-3 domain containing protein n=1 Tax=Aspergillus affinis TaxID=1070780 RepID=UPI0022FEE66D|nr:alpha beta hydrolase fold-3 domain containing protein [Aspergillus affinis]KAI9039191.1 alpha beta hydrolase fold-3 domain containing protein [Aspergillus affinis]
MLHYLNAARSSEKALSLPRAALLWSPWVDLTRCSGQGRIPSPSRHGLPLRELGRNNRSQFNLTLPGDKFAYISPLRNEFYSPTPVFVQTGTAELFYEDHMQFARGMENRGTKVEMVEILNAPHDTFGAGMLVGFAKEAEDAARRAAKFVDAAV